MILQITRNSKRNPPKKKKKTSPVTVFWDAKYMYVTEYLEAGMAVNSVQYTEMLKHL